MEEVNTKKKQKLDNLYNKYKPHEKFLIAKQARKTIRYIERNTMSFPNVYKVLKTRIIDCSYVILENIYRANIFQEIDYKKEGENNRRKNFKQKRLCKTRNTFSLFYCSSNT